MPSSIGTLREGPLHAALKQWVAQPGDRFEADVDGFVADVLRGDEIIEVQTGSFAALGKKLDRLLDERRVTVVVPLAYRSRITKLAEGGEIEAMIAGWKGRRYSLREDSSKVQMVWIDEAFELYRANFKTVALGAAILLFPVALLMGLAQVFYYRGFTEIFFQLLTESAQGAPPELFTADQFLGLSVSSALLQLVRGRRRVKFMQIVKHRDTGLISSRIQRQFD